MYFSVAEIPERQFSLKFLHFTVTDTYNHKCPRGRRRFGMVTADQLGLIFTEQNEDYYPTFLAEQTI